MQTSFEGGATKSYIGDLFSFEGGATKGYIDDYLCKPALKEVLLKATLVTFSALKEVLLKATQMTSYKNQL
jgi:hypothetical protein